MRRIAAVLVCTFIVATTQAQLTLKSMLDNINCASFGCFNSYVEGLGLELKYTVPGDNYTYYTYFPYPMDSSSLVFFTVAEGNGIEYFHLQTADKSFFEELYSDMINLYGYSYTSTQNNWEYYNSAITRKQIATQKTYNDYNQPRYNFMVYARENF